MSISTIKYADRLNMTLINEITAGGILSYKTSVYDGYYNFQDAYLKHISFIQSVAEQSLDLWTYNNGVKLVLKYTLTIHENTYTLKRKYQLYDIHGNLMNVPDTNIELTTIQNRVPVVDSYIPFSNCIQSIAYTDYSSNPPIVAGQQADGVEWIGILFYEKESHVGDVTPLYGSVSFNDLARTWELSSAMYEVRNDTDLNNAKTPFIQGGDGTDPWTTNEPSPSGPDPSGPAGGDIPSTDSGDSVDFPSLPTTSIISTGLVSLYNPTAYNLQGLAMELWGNDFEQSIKKILNDPFDGIIGLTLVPFTVHTSGSENCKIGNYESQISMSLIDQQFYTLDCGSIDVPASWKNALDYSPTTQVDIFIPFCGFRRLKTEDVMKNKITLKYNVDLLNGEAIAMVKCGDKVMYTYPCKLSYDVPLTGSNKAMLYTGMINIAMSAIHGGAIGGAVGAIGGASTSAINTMTSKQSEVERSGSIASNTGVLGDFTPYILIHRPVQSMPENFKAYKGYQTNITALLGTLSGYTEVDFIHLTGIDGATDEELVEIERLLKQGVIL